MITEDFVSLETAKLLKEKRFDGECSIYYDVEDRELDEPNRHEFAYDYNNIYIKAPTLQMAMKWLREVHNWTICISPYWPEGDMRNKLTWYYDIHSLIDNRSFREFSYTDNYTEAIEAAIKYCLENLI